MLFGNTHAHEYSFSWELCAFVSLAILGLFMYGDFKQISSVRLLHQ